MNRTSMSTGRSAPTDVTFFSSIARSSLLCRCRGISPISSRSRVPPLAIWKCPRRCSVAPVKAPLRAPNSSDSNSSAGIAAQLTATKGRSRRQPEKWIDRASSSFPTPVSPWIRTVVSRSTTERTRSKIPCMPALRAMILLKVKRSWFRRMVRRLADLSSWNSMARRMTSRSSAVSKGLTR